MPVIKTVLDDTGSVALKELVDAFNGQEIKATSAVIAGASGSTHTIPMIASPDKDLVITDIEVGVGSALVNAATDIFIEYDADLAFGSATAILDVQGFNTNNLAVGWHSVPDVVGDAVATQLGMPFLLPQGNAMQCRFVNTEGTGENLWLSVTYHPADDLIDFKPAADIGKVLKTANRVG